MFEYNEDHKHFENVLYDYGGAENNMCLFDFRNPDTKRKEYKAVRSTLYKKLKEQYGESCQLEIHDNCQRVGTVIDHLIPLSSNV